MHVLTGAHRRSCACPGIRNGHAKGGTGPLDVDNERATIAGPGMNDGVGGQFGNAGDHIIAVRKVGNQASDVLAHLTEMTWITRETTLPPAGGHGGLLRVIGGDEEGSRKPGALLRRGCRVFRKPHGQHLRQRFCDRSTFSKLVVFICEHDDDEWSPSCYPAVPMPGEKGKIEVTELARLYGEAQFNKHESFAAAINSHPLARESGVSVSRVSIGRYLSGVTTPDLAVARVIVTVLAARLGRAITLNDVWPVAFAPPIGDVALRYERSLPVTVECVAELLACEMDHARAQSIALLGFAPPAIAEAITGWRYGLTDAETGRETDTRQTTLRQVAQVRETRAWFAGLDHARGGGLIRGALCVKSNGTWCAEALSGVLLV
jgi:hypothetical protein